MSPARLLVACALLVGIGAHQVFTCAGWDSSAQARLACCERAGDCDEARMAEACCASGEAGDTAQVTAARAPHAPVAIAVSAVRPVATDTFLHARTPATVPSLAFRNAVLLI